MKRKTKAQRREQLLKQILLARFLERGDSMATMPEIAMVLGDPYAYTEMAIGTRNDVDKILDAILDGRIEAWIAANYRQFNEKWLAAFNSGRNTDAVANTWITSKDWIAQMLDSVR